MFAMALPCGVMELEIQVGYTRHRDTSCGRYLIVYRFSESSIELHVWRNFRAYMLVGGQNSASAAVGAMIY